MKTNQERFVLSRMQKCLSNIDICETSIGTILVTIDEMQKCPLSYKEYIEKETKSINTIYDVIQQEWREYHRLKEMLSPGIMSSVFLAMKNLLLNKEKAVSHKGNTFIAHKSVIDVKIENIIMN